MLLDNVKKWRILIAVFLAFVMMSIFLMCAVACGSGDSQEEKPGPSPEQPFDPDSPGEPDDGGSTVERVEITDVGTDILLCDSVINQYFTSKTEEEQIAVLKNHATITAENGGVPVRFSWKGNGSVKYTLYLSDNENFDNADTYVSSGLKTEIDVYNLLPATTYYYKVEGTRPGDCSDTLQFSTNSVSIRYIVADGAANTRDIGGYKSNNGTVNYGKIYRGSFAGGINGLTDDGRNTFEKKLKIKTEIDLRKDAKQKSEYLSENVGYYKFDVGSYTDIFDVATRNSLPETARRDSTDKSSEIKKLFEVLADESNYPVIIHCENGADSTGTMAFLINALLGVSEDDLIKDFELSTFSKLSGARYRSSLDEDGTFDDTGVMHDSEAFVAFGATINALKANYGIAGKSLSYAVENYLTSYVGVSSEEIENVKKIMLSEYTPSEIEYVGGDRQVIEVSKSDNSVNLGEIVYSSVEGVSVNNKDLGNSLSIDGSMLADFYGERELTVIVNTENGQKIVKVPVLIVTKYISTAEDLKTALKISEQGNYGYYELKDDITLDAFANDVGDVAFNGGNGFCGIFEGKNYTITSTPGNHGLFGYVSGGATIRNVNFEVTGNVNVSGKTVIGDYIVDSRIENVNVNIPSTEFGEDGAGIISAEAFNGNTVNGLTINAENAFINSLFGGGAHLFAGNEFDACEIRVQDIKEIARNYIDGKYVSVYLEDVEGFGGEISSTVEISVADIINIKGSNIELSVGERFANSKIAEIECNGKKINEYKFANGVLYLYNDSEIFGEIGGTVINITFEGVNGILVETEISAVIFTNSEEITLDGTQEIFVDRENNSVDLKDYSGASVYSISCNGYYFGTDVTSLHIDAEFRNNTLIHGSNMLTVLIGKDNEYYTLQIPVTVITKEISDVDQFNELFKSDNAEYAIYGYYKLTANIGDPKSEFDNGYNGEGEKWQNVDGLYGFRGTLDGAGYSVTGTVLTRGLIGLVGKGAVIKNLTVNAYGYANGRTVLARSIRSAVIENVKINIKSGESDSYLTEGGIITALMSHSTIYRNIVITSDGKVDTLFGCSYWNYDPSKANTFDNVKVTVKSIGGLLCLRKDIAESLYTIDDVKGITVAYVRSYEDETNTVNLGSEAELTLGAENTDITEINSITFGKREIKGFTFKNGTLTITEEEFTHFDIGAQTLILEGKVGKKQITVSLGVTIVLSAEEVPLGGDREIVLAEATEYDLNLGDYSDSTVIAATLGGENVTYANGKLIVTEEYKANVKKHGMQTLKVTVEKEGKYYIVSVNVLVVTKAISTIDELTAAMTAGPDKVVYGYYRLTQSVGSSNAWISVQCGNGNDWINPDGSLGFRGTLDGAGFAVDGNFGTYGLFGIIGNGAVIKNITFNAYLYQNGWQTLARSITGATIEAVTINIKSISEEKGPLDATAEGGVITGLMSHTSHYKDVTINAEGKDLDTLFGKSYGNYKAEKANTFENCKVNAKSLVGLVHSNEIISAAGIEGLNVTLYKDAVAAENMTVGQAAVIALHDLTEITSIVLDDEEFTAYSFENGTLTINADAFTAFQTGVKKFGVTAKNEQGLTVVFEITTTVELVADPVTLEGDREIVLAEATEYDLNLGDYSDSTVIAATLGGENVTYANGKLIVTEEYKANVKKHGMQTLKVTVEKEGKYYIVSVNVLVVTKAISTIDELTAAMTAGPDKVVYGYYRLTQSVGSSNAWISVQCGNGNDWINPDGSLGFRGTLDGAGFAVDGNFGTYGLFGIIGNGAVIKNITFNAYLYQNGWQTLARSITGATIEAVTINIKSISEEKGPLDATAEGGVITGLMSHTSHYKDVTINAEGKDLDTLFGKSYGNYKAEKANTFENCKVNAKSLVGLVHSNEIIPATGISGLTIPE